MDREQIDKLIQKYISDFTLAGGLERRIDDRSLSIIHAIVRKYKPKTCLEIGTWLGGSTCTILFALLKNKKKFKFIASEIEDGLRIATKENVLRVCGKVPQLIGDITKEFDKVPQGLDFLLSDTNHDEETIDSIIKNIFPKLKDGAWVIFHDWAVKEENGKWLGKGIDGIGSWPETEYLINLYKQNRLPLERVYWTYENGSEETGIFRYKSL